MPITNSVELGVKFRSDVAGRITGIRFYKADTKYGGVGSWVLGTGCTPHHPSPITQNPIPHALNFLSTPI